MPEFVTDLPPDEFRRAMAELPGILAGTRPDPHGIGMAFRLRIAVAFLEKVKLAFIVKSRGGTDDAGISWPKLSREYLAYGRGPFSSRKAGKSAPGVVRGGPRDGEQKDGFLSKAQLAQWRKIYGAALSRMRLLAPEDEAKGLAAAIAWNALKAAGARTKLQVFGSREVDILRDRGILFNSLSPGTIAPRGLGVDYQAPPQQVITESGGVQRVGTNVAYAGAHHAPQGGKRPARRLWPSVLPEAWENYLAKQAMGGTIKSVLIILSGGRSA